MDTDHPPAEHSIEKYLGLMESFLREFIAHSPFKVTFSIQKAEGGMLKTLRGRNTS